MRCNPFRWLFGIFPLLLLGGVALFNEAGRIEADLTARTQQALEQAGLGWASTSFEGRDATMTGLAAEDTEPVRAAAVAAKTYGVRIVRNDAKLIDKVERYDWVASRRDGRIRLSGLVPSEKTRRDIIGIARATFPSSEIVDRLSLARGAPALDIWLGGVGFGLKQLALLKGGTVRLETTELTVAGEAVDAAAYRAVKTALATGLPPGVSLKADRVEAPVVSPYVWSVRLADGQLDMRGVIPSEKVREDLLTIARRGLPKVKPVDGMSPARGEPDGWEAVARALLTELTRLEEGSIEIRDQAVTIVGVATKEATAEEIHAKLKEAIPGAYRTIDRITFREPTIKTVSPYQTSLVLESNSITLTGFVPSEAARAALISLANARFPGKSIVDRLELGAGPIPGWQRCLDIGFGAIAKLGNGKMSLTDRRLVIEGDTELESVAKALPSETRVAANRDCEPDLRLTLKVKPEPMLKWSAATSGATSDIVLEGQVPGQAARDELLATVVRLFKGRNVVDRLEVVNVSSDKWMRTATLALTQLARLRLGRAQIINQDMSVDGEARDVVAHAAIRDALGRGMPEGYTAQESIAVRSDAMIAAEQTSARKSEEDARKQAKAEEDAKAVAAAEVRRHAEEEARRRADDETRRTREANAARLRAEDDAKRRSEEEARKRAEEELSRKRVENAARQAREAETRRAEQERARKQVQASACETALKTVSREGVIQFDWASSTLDRRSYPTIEKLAQAALACPDVIIDIEGHTDAEGIDERNQPLSERRAQAVVDRLVAAGVPAARMKAVGYGAARPVAPNDTAANRARNRRIEFTVKAN
jgi:outer membrane protein OmpA-like peptidoglycan-associated protein